MAKENCWEYKKCGREPGGKKVKEAGACPAASETALNGVHGGKNAGRTCWVVAGTLCKGGVQGSFARKYETCTDCDFYRLVRKEEGSGFALSVALLKKLS